MTEFDKRHRLPQRPSVAGDRWRAGRRGIKFQRDFDAR